MTCADRSSQIELRLRHVLNAVIVALTYILSRFESLGQMRSIHSNLTFDPTGYANQDS